MQAAEHEADRLALIRSLDLLGLQGAPDLDRITQLTAQALGAPTGYFFRDPEREEPAAAWSAAADEGIRLLRAFSRIRDPALRDLIIRLTSIMARVEPPDSQSH